MQQLQRVAGTSAGAITATLVSLKYTAAEILQIVNATDFSTFEDSWDPLRVATKYGLYEGDAFLSWLQQRITNKGLASTATFQDFQNAGCLDLNVFATDLNTQGLKHFSVGTTPNVVVAEAVRASMSIPLFFKAWTFTNNNPDNHIYIDGGVIYNYPITIFDQDKDTPNPETLGLFLTNLGTPAPPSTLGYDHLIEYVGALADTMLNAQVIDFQNDPDQEERSIIIDNLGISATNFKLMNDQKTALYASGQKYATAFLAKHA